MKIWSKVTIKDKNKDVDIISKSFTNYIYGNGPINDIYNKYKVDQKDRLLLEQYTSSRIAGLLMLYLSKNYQRIDDIANRYNKNNNIEITPVIEAYIEK